LKQPLDSLKRLCILTLIVGLYISINIAPPIHETVSGAVEKINEKLNKQTSQRDSHKERNLHFSMAKSAIECAEILPHNNPSRDALEHYGTAMEKVSIARDDMVPCHISNHIGFCYKIETCSST
jgi:hypothetical protein